MDDCFIVLFTRNDQASDEEYYYYEQDAAYHHFNLFLDDDSCLYRKIELLRGDCVLESVCF